MRTPTLWRWRRRPAYPDLRPRGLAAAAPGAWPSEAIDASTAVWTDPDVRWADFDLVLANGAWDNIHHPDEFLAVGRARGAAVTRW